VFVLAATEEVNMSAPKTKAAVLAVDLDALFSYGLGNGSALGGDAHMMLSFPVWRTARALGTIEVGVKGTYQNEPLSLQPWAEGPTTGTTHRIGFAATVGHSFRFGVGDRISFGVHVYGGGVHWISNYDVRYDAGGIAGPGYINATVPDVGALLRFSFRPHPVVGFTVQIAAPFFGLSPDTVVGLFTVAGGLTLRFK
jgi:hypothetical protein